MFNFILRDKSEFLDRSESNTKAESIEEYRSITVSNAGWLPNRCQALFKRFPVT
jgi:hypothetical protein